jgi:catechol 2,3-dioxygenase-like lactoylglutathione lyase family enzyme
MIRGYRFTIFASDLERSRHFYEQQLGCRLDNITDVGFTAHRDTLEFVVEGGANRRKLGKAWLGEAGLYITIVTDDFDGLIADLQERDAPFLDDINELPDGKRVTGLADPDGVLFEVREA